jgi:hypothetical protein
MSTIRHRLKKLEQRLDKGLTPEQIDDRLRELLTPAFGIDLSECAPDELMEYAYEFIRQDITHQTGQDCDGWSHDRLRSEYRNLLGSMAT